MDGHPIPARKEQPALNIGMVSDFLMDLLHRASACFGLPESSASIGLNRVNVPTIPIVILYKEGEGPTIYRPHFALHDVHVSILSWLNLEGLDMDSKCKSR